MSIILSAALSFARLPSSLLQHVTTRLKQHALTSESGRIANASAVLIISEGFGGESSGAKMESLRREAPRLQFQFTPSGHNFVDAEEIDAVVTDILEQQHNVGLLIASSRGGKVAARLLERGWSRPVIAISALATASMCAAVTLSPSSPSSSSSHRRRRLLLLHGAHDSTNTIERVERDVAAAASSNKNGCTSNVKLVVFPDDNHSLPTCAQCLGRLVVDLCCSENAPLFESFDSVSYFNNGTFEKKTVLAATATESTAAKFPGGFCIKCNVVCPAASSHKCPCGHYPSHHSLEKIG